MEKLRFINDFVNEIKKQKTKQDAINKIIELYEFSKDVSNYANYIEIRNMILRSERQLPYYFIINTDTKNNELIKSDNSNIIYKNNIDCFSNDNEILDYIVYTSRKHIYNLYHNNTSVKIPGEIGIDSIDLANMCQDASKEVKLICDILSLKNKMLKIEYAFDKEAKILNGNGFHYLNLVKIGEKNYLIDLTYKQFFDIKQNELERLNVFGMTGCLPGIYMMYDENRKKIAKKILDDGWITFNNNCIKHYFDGFALSFRNGLYYDDKDKIDYETRYNSDDYIKFLTTDDSQVKRESLKSLGTRKHEFKHKINFKTDLSKIEY